jgi:hypothetical protein
MGWWCSSVAVVPSEPWVGDGRREKPEGRSRTGGSKEKSRGTRRRRRRMIDTRLKRGPRIGGPSVNVFYVPWDSFLFLHHSKTDRITLFIFKLLSSRYHLSSRIIMLNVFSAT